jgi:hypothetical protein
MISSGIESSFQLGHIIAQAMRNSLKYNFFFFLALIFYKIIVITRWEALVISVLSISQLIIENF